MYIPAPQKEMNVLKLSHNRKILRFTSTVSLLLFLYADAYFLSIFMFSLKFMKDNKPQIFRTTMSQDTGGDVDEIPEEYLAIRTEEAGKAAREALRIRFSNFDEDLNQKYASG